MEHLYPPGPDTVPPNFTAATAAYKRHAWLAMLGLTAFIAVYFALSAWFAWTSWRLMSGMLGPDGNFELLGFGAGLCAAFLAVFMLKALFFIQHRYAIEDIEVTRAQQPRLFDFIDRLADEARAPRAHKVYLSPRVNAAVFYDLSLLNLIIPSKKNLEIGLGLVNVVSLGELKAVLAHEFGHFAQRSMAVGRWVYISQQIAGHVVARRDALDKLLQQLSRIDLRVAWIGWVLSIIVWSIRSTMDVLFRVVLLAQRALSRQMEFQADLVSVSLTGSDALIHALHRLNAADDAWDKTLSFANSEAGSQRGITDLFAVQTRIIERMREILNQPLYGAVPPLPTAAPDTHRVFKTELAQPPRMWVTHPANSDRERNAKQRYVAAPVDGRSAWDLFQEPQALKEQMSKHVYRNSKVEPTPADKTFEQLDKEYGRAFLNRAYRGTYLNRSPVRYAQNVAELYGPPVRAELLPQVLAQLYPADLADQIERLNEKLEEKAALEALRDSQAQAPGGVIRRNGGELRRSELPRAIEELAREISAVRAQVESHDKLCRTAHLSAARTLACGWPEYLQALTAMLHYADHCEANLRDVQGYVINIYNIVTADGRVSSAELTRLIEGCQQLYSVLKRIHTEGAEVTLDRTLARRLEVDSWQAMLEEFKLPPPNRDNIGEWLKVIDGWTGAAIAAMARLRAAALEQLLLAESQVSKFVRDSMQPVDAPPASTVPREYARLMPGNERQRQQRLDWWDRFQVADGIVPMLARSAVAIGIVGGVVALGAQVGVSHLTIYNALATPVRVMYGDQSVYVNPFSPTTVSMPASGRIHIQTFANDDRDIETFEEEIHGANARYVYNVASAAPLYSWQAVYTSGFGNNQPPGQNPLGAPRWSHTFVDHVFEQPPQSIEVRQGSNGYRSVLSAATDVPPYQQTQLVTDLAERTRLVLAHARWDATSTPHILEWLQLATTEPGYPQLLAERLKRESTDVVLLRHEQDSSSGPEHESVCTRHRARAAAQPDDANLVYLEIRCLDDNARMNEQFIAAQRKWPDHPWLSYAVATTLAERRDYRAAEPLYEKALKALPSMREYLGMESARMRRLNAGPSNYNIDDLVRFSTQLGVFAAIESGRDVAGTPLEPYAAIARGELGEATAKATALGKDGARALRLIAASDGATREMMDAAFALPFDDTIDLHSTLTMYGIAARTRHDPAPYAQRLEKMLGPSAKATLAFLQAIQRGGNPDEARAALPLLDLSVRLSVLNAATLMLAANAPRAWRDEISRGLFVGERGYIGPVHSSETAGRATVDRDEAIRDAPALYHDRAKAATPASSGSHPARILLGPGS